MQKITYKITYNTIMKGYYMSINTHLNDNRIGVVMYYSEDKESLEKMAIEKGAIKEKNNLYF